MVFDILVETFVAWSRTIFGVKSPVQADCVMHEFTAVADPSLHRAQAIVLTPETVLSRSNGQPSSIAIALETLLPTGPCHDESRRTNLVARLLTSLWQYGLDARQNVAALKPIVAGSTTADP